MYSIVHIHPWWLHVQPCINLYCDYVPFPSRICKHHRILPGHYWGTHEHMWWGAASCWMQMQLLRFSMIVCVYVGTFIFKTQGLLIDNNSLGIITLTLPLFTSGILLRCNVCAIEMWCLKYVIHQPPIKEIIYQNVTIPKLHLDYLYMQRNDFSASILIILKGNYNVQLHTLVQKVTHQWCWCFWCIIHQGG